MDWIRFWDYAKKAGVSLLGCIATLAANNLLPEPFDKYVPIILAVATYFGVYAIRNTSPKTAKPLLAGSDPPAA
jgi:hypothetical protein